MAEILDLDQDSFQNHLIGVSEKGKGKFKIEGSDLKGLYAYILDSYVLIKLELFELLNPKITYYFAIAPAMQKRNIRKVYQILAGGFVKGSEGKVMLWEQKIVDERKLPPEKKDSSKIKVVAGDVYLILQIPITLVELNPSHGPPTLREVNAGVMVDEVVDDNQLSEKIE
ncbi:MAG: hypothetical protein ABIF10_01980 [Candidatus Woesearchaeota archaeon]